MNQTKRRSLPFYPFLIGVYAIVFLSSVNLGQVMLAVTVRSVIVSLVISLVIFLINFALLRSLHKAALASGLLLVVLFLYGQFFEWVDGLTLLGLAVGRHRLFLPLMALLTLAGLYFVFTTRKNLESLSVVLNVVVLGLIVMASLPILAYQVRYGGSSDRQPAGSLAGTAQASADAPDVYYIVLDGYSRSDVLARDFQYDNRYFTDGLRRMGFFLPDCSFSNYITTTPSLSSTLNMDYLENMGLSEKATLDAFDPSLLNLLVDSQVLQAFEGMGYQTAAFRGFIPALDLRGADYYYNFQEKQQQVNLIWMHTFERLFMRTSILRPLVEAYEADPDSLDVLPAWFLKLVAMQPDVYTVTERLQQLEMKYTFEILPTLAQLPGKKFVYAHIYATHTPYVFDRDGNYTPEQVHYNDSGYIPALEYTSKQILAIIQTLLETSETPPVIILQADHGMAATTGITHNKILTAYYFPDGDYSRLYSTITPVNTFRVVLNQFFARSYSLLPDTLLVKDVSADGQFTIRRVPAACDAR